MLVSRKEKCRGKWNLPQPMKDRRNISLGRAIHISARDCSHVGEAGENVSVMTHVLREPGWWTVSTGSQSVQKYQINVPFPFPFPFPRLLPMSGPDYAHASPPP